MTGSRVVEQPVFALRLATQRPSLPAAEGQSPRLQIERALTAAADGQRLARAEERDLVSKTWLGAQDNALQKSGRFFRAIDPAFTVAVGALGLFGSFIAGMAGSPGGPSPAFFPPFLTGVGITAGIVAVSHLVRGAATAQERATKRRMIERDQLVKPLQRLEAATGATRAQVRADVLAMQAKLEAAELLAPEARYALSVATQKQDEPGDVERAARYSALAQVMISSIDDGNLHALETALAATPVDERKLIAEILSERMFSDRKRVASASYATRNKLYDILRVAMTADQSATTET